MSETVHYKLSKWWWLRPWNEVKRLSAKLNSTLADYQKTVDANWRSDTQIQDLGNRYRNLYGHKHWPEDKPKIIEQETPDE